jgi:hypothetical protein
VESDYSTENPLTVDDEENGIFLYELCQLLGLKNATDLLKYFDTHTTITLNGIEISNPNFGNLDENLIDLHTYHLQVENQKTRLKQALTSYLSKGTIFDIKNNFEYYGATIDINVLWKVLTTEPYDIITISSPDAPFDPDIFSTNNNQAYINTNNSLLTKYGDAQFNLGEPYLNHLDAIYDEITGCGVPIVSGFIISDYVINERNYEYLINESDNALYFKTNDEPENGYTPNTWYKFDDNIDWIKVSEDYIFIHYLNNELKVYINVLESALLDGSPHWIVSNCEYLMFDADIDLLIIDVGTYFQIRKLSNFFYLSKVEKPISSTEPTLFMFKNDYYEYTVINNINNIYVLTLLNTSTPVVQPTIDIDHPLVPLTAETIVDAYYSANRKFIYFTNVGADIVATTIYLNQMYSRTSSSNTYTGLNTLGMIKFFEKIVLLTDDNSLLLFDMDVLSFISVIPLLSPTTADRIFFANKIQLYETTDPNYLNEIVGFDTGSNIIYKTHYFDASVKRSAETYTFLPTEQSVIELINYIKPLHTQLNKLYLIDDLGVFGWGTFGLGLFGDGEYSLIQ